MNPPSPPKSPGLIATFEAVSKVATPHRRPLCDNTRSTYITWIRKFHAFVNKPGSEWTGDHVQLFLWWLHEQDYAPKSRKQALCALVYVFKHVLKVDIGHLDLPIMPKEKKTLKVIPSRQEIGRIFAGLHGQARIMAGVIYGAGLRISECCQLRVKDIDFDAKTIRVHAGKGDKDRLCLLPDNLVAALQRQIDWRRALHEQDLAEGAGFVDLPGRLALKYKNAARDFRWQFLFPSSVLRAQRRWHTTPESIQKALRVAVQSAGILKTVTPHTLRHAYCTHSLRAGNDAATVQELMGHETLETTMLYAHADAARGVSPLDAPDLELTKRSMMIV